jgi:hypothetical protein
MQVINSWKPHSAAGYSGLLVCDAVLLGKYIPQYLSTEIPSTAGQIRPTEQLRKVSFDGDKSADYTARSESRCALRLRYVHLAVSPEVAVAVCCCFTVFSC